MLHIFFCRVWESYHISTDGKSSGSSKSCFSTWVRWRYEFIPSVPDFTDKSGNSRVCCRCHLIYEWKEKSFKVVGGLGPRKYVHPLYPDMSEWLPSITEIQDALTKRNTPDSPNKYRKTGRSPIIWHFRPFAVVCD